MIETKYGRTLKIGKAIVDHIHQGIGCSECTVVIGDHERPFLICKRDMDSVIVISYIFNPDMRLFLSVVRGRMEDFVLSLGSTSDKPLDRVNRRRLLIHIVNIKLEEVTISQPDAFNVIVRAAKFLCAEGRCSATSNIASIEEGAG